jgi:hypothetical protein
MPINAERYPSQTAPRNTRSATTKPEYKPNDAESIAAAIRN